MDRQRLLFIINPKSGMGQIKNQLLDITDIMVKAGFEVSVYTTQARGDAQRKVMNDGKHYDRIVCSGGDGTLDEVVTGMRQVDLNIPLGYIPAGSTNDFANSLGVSGDMLRAARIAVGDGIKSFDVGTFNDDIFVYIAAFGIFTEVSYETPQELKNALGHLAYILSAAKSLASIPNYFMQIETDGKILQDKFIYGMITNSTSVAGFKGMTGKDVELDDGKFEVLLVKSPANPIELNEILGFLTGVNTNTGMVYSFKTNRIRIRSKEEVAWTLDGEFGGRHNWVDIRNLCKKVQILVEKEK